MTEHTQTAAREGTATTRDGTRISYRLVRGGGAGRCVLIHSLAMDKTFWDGVVASLAGDADVLVYDCRGHGASSKPAGPYRVETFADDVADLMQAVGWDSAVVAGASMGGCVALAVAAAYPERVDGLGLFDTTAWYGDNAPAAWEERARKALDEGMAALVGFQKTRWFGDAFREARPDVVDAAVSVFLANDVDAYAETCRMLGAVDKRSALPGFAVPTRIVVGSQDYATPPAMAEAMAKAIPGAELFILDGARHFTPLERPAEIAEHLRSLLAAARRG